MSAVTLRALMRHIEGVARSSALPIDRELLDWPVYLDPGEGQPVIPLTIDAVQYGFVGGRSCVVLEVGR